MHLVGCTIEIYYGARSYKRPIRQNKNKKSLYELTKV
jgi:hypothetical protein